MATALLCFSLFVLQTPVAGPQSGAVSNPPAGSPGQIKTLLLPNHPVIGVLDRGKLVQLQHGPGTVYLPIPAPPTNSPEAKPWFVDVVNFGPADVTLHGGATFNLVLHPKQTAHIVARGSSYYVQP